MARIAIIGAGISGLGAAYLLHALHDITVFEKNAEVGGHARTRSARCKNYNVAVDTGFIVFNYRNYPHLSGLFKTLNVPVNKSNMTFAVRDDDENVEWGAQSVNALFGQRRNLWRPAFWRMLFDIVRFNARAAKTAEKNPAFTLGQLLDHMRMGAWFRQYYLLPMGGAIWSCSLEQMLAYPALAFTRFFKNHGLLTITDQPQWYTVTGGSREYVRRMTKNFENKIRVNADITRVARAHGKVVVTFADGSSETFDHVIFACPAAATRQMLSEATASEDYILSSFETQENTAYLHKDQSVMPRQRRCWSSWVYQTARRAPTDRICVTYWMNQLQDMPQDCPLFVTLNPLAPISDEDIFDRHVFHHPVYTTRAVRAQKDIADIQGLGNVWHCGAWLKNGFHEDGLSSAVDVVRALGGNVPWTA